MGDDVEQKVGSDTAPAFESGAGDELALEETSLPEDAAGDADEGGAKIVKICKTCMVSQAGEDEFCCHCGAELVPIRAVRESYVGETVGEKYKIVDRLGAGGMGEVYLGLNEPLGQRVAVKFLSKKFTADEGIIMRFLNEARSYCKVTHPNAVTLLEYGQHDDGALYLITEFIEGDSLTETLKQTGPFGLKTVISVGAQVCEVLSAAHRQGVIHRDLKPDNIMLMPTSRGRYAAKVLDFGIAKIVDDDHEHGPMTETGSVFGTPEFMSPEQARGDAADPRSDLYAMGIILFYMATGKLPFKGKNKFVILNKQLNEQPPRPSDARADIEVPRRLEAVILKCLSKESDERYQSADDLLEALEQAKAASGSADTLGAQARTLGLASSEVSDSPNDTPSRPHSTDAPGIHESETVRHDLDAPLHTDPTRAAEVELGEFDDATGEPGALDEVDLPGEWAEREAPAYEEKSRLKPAAAVLVVLFAAGAAVWAIGGADDGDEPADGGQAESGVDRRAAAPLDIDQVLVTGQVLGSLSAAEDNLRHGDLDSTRRALETTYDWVDDDALPEKARDRRAALDADLERLNGLSAKVEKALDDSDCSRARRLNRTVSDISEGLARRFKDRVDACKAGAGREGPSREGISAQGGGGAAGGGKPAQNSAQQPQKEAVEEAPPQEPHIPEEEDESGDQAPQAPGDSAAPPETNDQPQDDQQQDDQQQDDQTQSADSPGDDEQVEEGALPPKKLD